MKDKFLPIEDLIYKPISGEWGDDVGDVNVLRTTNFNNDGTLNLSEVVKRSIDLSKVEKKKLKYGDTIIEKSGGSPSQPVGRVVYFNIKDDIFLCNNFTSVIRPKENIDSRYLFWFLFSNHINQNTRKYQNKTTGIINLQLERYVKDLQIPLPPLATQKRIAEILDAADALVRKDQELLKKYDELAQAIFIDMFGDPVKNEKGWEVKTIEQIVKKQKNSIKRGPFGGALKKEIFVKDGYLVYEQYHALNNDFSFGRYFIAKDKYNELIGFKVQPDDIIISCSGVYLGKLAIVPKDAKEGIINQALLKLTLDQNIYKNDFFVKVFTQENFKEKYFDSDRGAAIPNFPPMSAFKKFKFIAPPIEIQNKYLNIVKNLQLHLSVMNKCESSANLFNSLLQKAFKGELVK
jgi:type I restriction enzyme S subunit